MPDDLVNGYEKQRQPAVSEEEEFHLKAIAGEDEVKKEAIGVERERKQQNGKWWLHNFWDSPFLKLILAVLAIGTLLVSAFGFKVWLTKGQQEIESIKMKHQQDVDLLKMKQTVVDKFARSIILAISYYDIHNDYKRRKSNAKMKMDQTKETSNEYKKRKEEYENANKLYEKYYEKYCSLDPPYAVSCELIKLYFSENENIKHDTEELQNKLKEFVEVREWSELNERGDLWIESSRYINIKKEIEKRYEDLIKIIILEVKIKEK